MTRPARGSPIFIAAILSLLLLLMAGADLQAQRPGGNHDYWAPQREMIARGQQAIMVCNGLFTSNRSLEQIYEQELTFLANPIGTPQGGDYVVDRARRAVAIGDGVTGPVIRAAYREGLGCVSMAPHQTFDDIDELPILDMAPPPGDPATIPWPDGDFTGAITVPAGVDAAALNAASDWAFNRESPFQNTLSLVVVHEGRIVHERYAPGVDANTRTRTWSVAKSIAGTLIGILVDEGRLSLDEPLGFDWQPDVRSPEADPRRAITLRDVLQMASGLYPIDNQGLEYATGSGLGYWAGDSSVRLALDRGVVRDPGTYWDYENSDTLLGVYKMRRVLGDDRAYLEFPRRALFDRIGMRNTVVGPDRFGDFVLSSQIYTSARDLARLGLLYLQGGVWNEERILSQEWIDFSLTPAPSTSETGNFYGAQWWLVPDNRKGEVPPDAYAAVGNRGQYVIVVPSQDLVIVRRGLDWGRQGFDRWALTAEILKAFP